MGLSADHLPRLEEEVHRNLEGLAEIPASYRTTEEQELPVGRSLGVVTLESLSVSDQGHFAFPEDVG